jgi:hypothetical protein
VANPAPAYRAAPAASAGTVTGTGAGTGAAGTGAGEAATESAPETAGLIKPADAGGRASAAAVCHGDHRGVVTRVIDTTGAAETGTAVGAIADTGL